MKTFKEYINETMEESGHFVVIESDDSIDCFSHEFFDTKEEAVDAAEEIINVPADEIKMYDTYYQVAIYEADPKTFDEFSQPEKSLWAKHVVLEDGIIQIRDGEYR